MSKTIKVAIAGLGTVGVGVVANIQRGQELLAARTGSQIAITAVSSRTKSGRAVDISAYQWFDNPLDLIKTDADIIVETIGGDSGIAYQLVEAALSAGKHVVTANKALLAMHGNRLAGIARAKNVTLAYEAAIAGGIPIVKTLREGLGANIHSRVYGILNGTCNYILSEMEKTKINFKPILEQAQKLGYAEADPTLDIGGFDAAHKLTLLSAIAFGCPVNYEATYVEGIEKIELIDIMMANKIGYRIKLLGVATMYNNKVMQRVYPALVRTESHIAQINGPYNAVVVQSDYADETLIVGCGAGREPTASAVVADIMDIARGLKIETFGTVPSHDIEFQSVAEREGQYYLRLRFKDKAGAIAEIARLLSDKGISIHSLIQENLREDHQGSKTAIVVTHQTLEKTMLEAIAKITQSDYVISPPLMIRILSI
ncbi:MAG: homoserine dehydrogenase [Alphaproteobacteria bacterium]|jgi:homoserine dehydrogenase